MSLPLDNDSRGTGMYGGDGSDDASSLGLGAGVKREARSLPLQKPAKFLVLIDSGGPPEPLLEAIKENDLTVEHLLLTHHHADHVMNNGVFKKELGVEIIGTTLAGYTGARPKTDGPDLELLGELAGALPATSVLVAEGRVHSPAQAAAAKLRAA